MAASAAAAARMKAAQTANIAVIGDEETVTGFLLAGVGAVDAKKDATYLIVDAKTKHSEIEAAFQKFSTSPDVGILLISQPVTRLPCCTTAKNFFTSFFFFFFFADRVAAALQIAESIRYLVSKHTRLIPTILEMCVAALAFFGVSLTRARLQPHQGGAVRPEQGLDHDCHQQNPGRQRLNPSQPSPAPRFVQVAQ